MPHIEGKRYAVVSCHVERPLDDRCWSAFAALQERRPGGFRVAALMRPPEPGEDPARWLQRAREAAARAPLGHHTHFGDDRQARPLAGDDPAARVRAQAAWLRENGLQPALFAGGGWYLDERVALALAELGYADCTATAFRPRYLAADAPRVQVDAPTWLRVDGSRLLELPSTHSLGMAARAALVPLAAHVHVYFHDTDLLSRVRRAALVTALRVLGARRRRLDLDELRAAGADREVEFSAVSSP